MKPIIDMHNHTFLSACSYDETANAASYIDKAVEVGIQVLGISNHCWDDRMPGASSWYRPQTVEHCLQIKEEMPADTKGVKVFIGVESEYACVNDHLGISAEGAAKFDYVLIPHTHTHMVNFVIPSDPNYNEALGIVEQKLRAAFPEVSDRQIEKWMAVARNADVKQYWKGPDIPYVAEYMCKSFVDLMNNEEFNKVRVTVPTFVAHPFCACGYSAEQTDQMLSLIPDERFIEMFTVMAEKNVGYDISVGNFVRNDKSERAQMFRLLALAKQCGVKFTFGTDAHSVAGLSGAVKCAQIYKNGNMTPDDLHPMYREFVTFE